MRIIIYYYRISRLERHIFIIFLIYFYHNFPNIFFIIIFLIYSNYHYINANYILSQEATALGPSHDIGYLSPDSSLDPYRAEYGCGYPVKRLFELLEFRLDNLIFSSILWHFNLNTTLDVFVRHFSAQLPRYMMVVVLIEVVF